MSNSDSCAALGNSVEGGLDDLLTLRINRTGCLVEDDDARLLYDTSGDRETLLLTTGELRTTIADASVIALDILLVLVI